MSVLKEINKENLPRHVAIIMDGNGRWAKNRNQDRAIGHKEGVSTVRKVIEATAQLGIPFLTLYTFSTENWNRPEEEIKALMSLMIQAVANETPDLIKNGVKVIPIGDIERLPIETQKALDECVQRTAHCERLSVVLALSYSSKWEITNAMKQVCKDVQGSKFSIEDIDEDTIEQYLTTKNIPDPDILIRTGGEKRISNFLLWQIAYSELYFTDELWPDFKEESLYKAVVDYQLRERRYGQTSEQITSK